MRNRGILRIKFPEGAFLACRKNWQVEAYEDAMGFKPRTITEAFPRDRWVEAENQWNWPKAKRRKHNPLTLEQVAGLDES